jgi:D-3-phosphoglycerate dehydrogenase / 2-oxoglutarate reductase
MVNKSRGDIAYTMLDLDSPAAASSLAKIRAIAGVMTVRELPQRQE